MNWITLAMLAPLLYAIANILDVFALRKIKSIYAFGSMHSFFYLIIVSFLVFIYGVPQLPRHLLPIAIGLGILGGITHLFFFYLIQRQDVSQVIGIIYIYPAFVALLSFVILNEQISPSKYVAVFIAITGALILALEHNNHHWIIAHHFLMMIALALIMSFIDVGLKYVLAMVSPFQLYPIYLFTISICLLLPLLGKRVRKSMVHALPHAPFVGLIAATSVAGSLLFQHAAQRGPITIVSSLATMQPMFVLVFSIIVHFISPSLLEYHDHLLKKIIGIILVITAAVLLAL